MSLKEKMQQKIEKNAIKSELDGEVVYLKKSAGVFSLIPFVGNKMKEWHEFYPPINEDGSWNTVNLLIGGRKNFIKLMSVLLIVAIALYGVYLIFTGMQDQVSTLCNKYVPLQVADNNVNMICGHPLVQSSAAGGSALQNIGEIQG